MNESENELTLGDYVALVKRRWRMVVVTTIVVLGAVLVSTVTADRIYRTQASVLILTDSTRTLFSTTSATTDLLVREPRAELEFVEDDDFNDTAAAVLGRSADITYSLRAVDRFQEEGEAGRLVFVVEDSSPDRAVEAADSYAETYIEERHNLDVEITENQLLELEASRAELNAELAEAEAGIVELTNQLAVTPDPVARSILERQIEELTREIAPFTEVLGSELRDVTRDILLLELKQQELENPNAAAEVSSFAVRPSSPSSPNVVLNILLALVAGLVLGLIVAITRDFLDRRARDANEIASLVDVPVIAAIGELPRQRSAPGGVRRFSDLTDADASGYRVLLNSLWLSTVDGPMQSIAFTSDRPGVGKTQTVVNLAQAEAARGTKVLIVDTDFVNPSVCDRLDLERPTTGLGDALSGASSIEAAIVTTGITNLDLLDAFAEDEHAGDLLRSDKLRMLLSQLYMHYDLIVLDSPPTLSTADSRLVASQADAAVVVYDPSESLVDELQRSIELLRSARVNLIGLVANRTRATQPVYVSARER